LLFVSNAAQNCDCLYTEVSVGVSRRVKLCSSTLRWRLSQSEMFTF